MMLQKLILTVFPFLLTIAEDNYYTIFLRINTTILSHILQVFIYASNENPLKFAFIVKLIPS
jgi:hypothetical protein